MAIAAFILLAVLAILGALSVILNRSPLYSALSLVVVFMATAGLYLMLHAQFLAILQILVYAGAIMVLFIFVIMLLSLKREEEGELTGLPSGIRRVVAIVLSALLFGQFAFLGSTLFFSGKVNPETGGANPVGSAAALGENLYQNHMIAFQVTGVLLLVAIVGAIALTRRHGRGLEGHMGEGQS